MIKPYVTYYAFTLCVCLVTLICKAEKLPVSRVVSAWIDLGLDFCRVEVFKM